METTIRELLDESIVFELNVAALYEFFHKIFPEDSGFWMVLMMEENDHASLLQTGKETYDVLDDFPYDLIPPTLEGVQEANRHISRLLQAFRNNPPTREAAFNTALAAEQLAGEIQFQNFMEASPASNVIRIFQQLNNENKNHAKRIAEYMKLNGIPEAASGA